jgi:hypothetical protein
MEVVLLAPGPSMSQDLADSFRGRVVGVVSNCFELAPWADFMAAQDRKWWEKYPQAKQFAGRKFSANRIAGVERVAGALTNWNSGVLALQAAVHVMGAKRILLYGFDMHGTHFFGRYENGLGNTIPSRRLVHLKQYRSWAAKHQKVEVINCTPGSSLDCFPFAT